MLPTPYYKAEWFDATPIETGDVIQLANYSFGTVVLIVDEDTEDGDGNILSTDTEYHAVCLYTGKLHSLSERQGIPLKIKREYISEVLGTAPYHRWIFENYDEFYSKDTVWMDWFCNHAREFDRTIRGYVERADEFLSREGATWEREYPSEEWQAAFWEMVNGRNNS